MSRASTLPLITFSYEPFSPLFSPAVLRRPFFPEPTQLPRFPFPVNVSASFLLFLCFCPIVFTNSHPISTFSLFLSVPLTLCFPRPLEKRFNTFLLVVVARRRGIWESGWKREKETANKEEKETEVKRNRRGKREERQVSRGGSKSARWIFSLHRAELAIKVQRDRRRSELLQIFFFPLILFPFSFSLLSFVLLLFTALPPFSFLTSVSICLFVCLFVCLFLTISCRQGHSFLRPKSYYVTCRKSAFCKISRAGPFFQREMSVDWIKAW